ncbi:MAG: histidine--tRNA ligase [Pseudomonadota bacterium]|nr:histidine--tRNA ligase [Pseudomonadota bacterium]
MNKKSISNVRGMHDIFEKEYYKHQFIVESFVKVSSLFNFVPMITPIIEHSEVFSRTLGNSSDVVMKEMYSFLDKSEDSLTLRPEGTAAIARALISNSLTQSLPQRLFYHGPMFRYERPQKGRLRQFHQVGIELFGKGSFSEDYEIIRVAFFFLKNLNIIQNISLKINTIGNSHSRSSFVKEIKKYFENNKKKLSSDSLKRLERNPLRILDSKDPQDIDLLKEAPIIYDFLDKEELDNFENIKALLHSSGIEFKTDPLLVRGLDYYSETTFEFTLMDNEKFAILAGGRYSNLVEDLGGISLSGIGWAAGIERLANLAEINNTIPPPILIIPAHTDYLSNVLRISDILYHNQFKHQVLNHFNLKKSMKYANKIKAKKAIIIGENEFNKSVVSLKNLENGQQLYLDPQELIEKLKNE